ncbi:Putative DNA-binding protein [Salmonella enterica subsp. enterica]|uniref:DNA-binding protein n=1 Tax=Salmonella enterica I TaxID=59201 RepID=A0A3S4LX71_SALET|nr:Putative DNA-binding protein [Salmonella enterica subsp. enterica]
MEQVYHRSQLVKDWAEGGKYQAALPSPLQSKPESDRTNVEINERTCPE